MITPRENPGYLKSQTVKTLARVTDRLKQHMLDILNIRAGSRVIDVGCGPGVDTVAMAGRVGERGVVVGIDYDANMVKEAAASKVGTGLESVIHLFKADATALPFKSGRFDACRCERVLQHVPNPNLVIGEMLRIIKSGGRIAIADTDWGTLSIDTSEVDLERRLARFRAEMYYNGYAGRQLFRLLKQHRTTDLSVNVYPIVWTDYEAFRAMSFALNNFEEMAVESGAVDKEELQRFVGTLEDANENGVFFASGCLILVAGSKP